MADHQETFAGCEIVIENDSALTINGKVIEYTYDGVKKTWYSKYLPYTDYPSLIELARAIARDTVEFSTSVQ